MSFPFGARPPGRCYHSFVESKWPDFKTSIWKDLLIQPSLELEVDFFQCCFLMQTIVYNIGLFTTTTTTTTTTTAAATTATTATTTTTTVWTLVWTLVLICYQKWIWRFQGLFEDSSSICGRCWISFPKQKNSFSKNSVAIGRSEKYGIPWHILV